MVGSSYKIQKRELYFKVFTQKKYSYWFLDLLEDFRRFFERDLSSVIERLEKIKGASLINLKLRLFFQIDQAFHQNQHLHGTNNS